MDNNNETKGPTEAAATSTANNSSAATARKEYTLIAQDAELEIAPGKVVKT